MTRRRRVVFAAAGAGLLAAAGCQSPQQQARDAALHRWNAARADVKVKLAADQLAAGNVNAAASELAEAVRLDPDNPRHTTLRARIWLAEGRIGAAERLLESAELDDAEQAEAEYLLGVVRQQQQRWEEALAAFLRAAQRAPDELDYVVAAVQSWLQLGDGAAALAYLDERDGQFAWQTGYQAARAECYEQLGNWSAAATAWQRIVDGGEPVAMLQERLAVALCHAQRAGEAIPLLQALVADRPEVVGGWLRLLLAECYVAEGRLGAARDELQTLLRQDCDNPAALCLLARSLSGLGEFAAALRSAQRALELDPQDELTLELTAALAWRSGDRALAERLAHRLQDVQPHSAVAQRILHPAAAPMTADAR